MRLLFCFWSAILSLYVIATNTAAAEDRVALVVGLSDPRDVSTEIFTSDAKHVATSLAKAGFVVRTSWNPNKAELTKSIQTFVGAISAEGAIGAVYIASPLYITDGDAYLVPARIPPGSANASEIGMSVGAMLQKLGAAGSKRVYVAFDAQIRGIEGARTQDLPFYKSAVKNVFIAFSERVAKDKGRSKMATVFSGSLRSFGAERTVSQRALETAIASISTESVPWIANRLAWYRNGFTSIDFSKLWGNCPDLPPKFSPIRISGGTPAKVASVATIGWYVEDYWAWGDSGLRTSDFGPDIVSSIPVGVFIDFYFPIIVGTGIRSDGRAVIAMSKHYDNGYPFEPFGDDGFLSFDVPGYENVYAAGTYQLQEVPTIGGYAVSDDGHRAVVVAKVWSGLPTWYGTNGRVAIEIPNAPKLVINGVAPADKYYGDDSVLVGTADNKSFLIVKVKHDGTLDDAFGANGVARLPLTCGAAYAVARDDLGRYVVVGYTTLATAAGKAANAPVIAVARFLPDGKIDRLFGDNGLAVINIAYSSQEYATDVIVWSAPALSQSSPQPGPGQGGIVSEVPTIGETQFPPIVPIGPPAPDPWLPGEVVEIFVGANAFDSSGTRRFTLLRLKNDGRVETNFGTDGLLQIDFGEAAPGDAVLNGLKLRLSYADRLSDLESPWRPCNTSYCPWWRLMAFGSARKAGHSGPSNFALVEISMDGLVAKRVTYDFLNGGIDAATALSNTFKPDPAYGDILWDLAVGVQ